MSDAVAVMDVPARQAGDGSNEWKNRVILALLGLLVGGGGTTLFGQRGDQADIEKRLSGIEVRLAVIETKLATIEQRVKP